MPTENEPITAEKMLRRKFVALLGQCPDCGQQAFFRSDDGIRHAICIFDPAFAKRAREFNLKTGQ